MKNFFILILMLFPIFCFSQKKIATLKTSKYIVYRGGNIYEGHRNIKIIVYDNKMKLIYQDHVIPSSYPLKNIKFNKKDKTFTAQNKGRDIELYSSGDLAVQHKNYSIVYKIHKIKIE